MKLIFQTYSKGILSGITISLLFALLFGSMGLWAKLGNIASAESHSITLGSKESTLFAMNQVLSRPVETIKMPAILETGRTYALSTVIQFQSGSPLGIKVVSVMQKAGQQDAFDVTDTVYNEAEKTLCFTEQGDYTLWITAVAQNGVKSSSRVYVGVRHKRHEEKL